MRPSRGRRQIRTLAGRVAAHTYTVSWAAADADCASGRPRAALTVPPICATGADLAIISREALRWFSGVLRSFGRAVGERGGPLPAGMAARSACVQGSRPWRQGRGCRGRRCAGWHASQSRACGPGAARRRRPGTDRSGNCLSPSRRLPQPPRSSAARWARSPAAWCSAQTASPCSLASGAHRVDTAKVAGQLGARSVHRANPGFVRAATGAGHRRGRSRRPPAAGPHPGPRAAGEL